MSVRSTSLAETIVACATPAGSGAVAVVRLSGPLALEIGRRIAPSREPRRSHELRRVRVLDAQGGLVDDAMAVEMHAPRSYTGEDVLELHLHGAPAVVSRVIALCTESGARQAEPGEYTLRAFLNGRMDLAQAEAVGDLIHARSEEQREVALRQLGGGLSRAVGKVLEPLEAALAAWRAALDFPEHASGDGFVPEHDEALTAAKRALLALLESARLDLQRSRQVVLAGAPNVGKSSLLNAWVGSRRVLVDDTPGTTRDPIEVELTSGLLRWSVWDTAGVRSEATGLERAGIELTQERIQNADLVLWLVNPDEPAWPEEGMGRQVWAVGSKADLASSERRERVERLAVERGLRFWGWVSVKSGAGVLDLRDAAAKSLEAVVPAGVSVVVRERHAVLVREALSALGRLDEARTSGLTLDVWTLELEAVCRALGQVLGRDVDAEVLEQVFRDFCIGK